MPSSRGSSRPRDASYISYVSCIAGRFFTTSATWEALAPAYCLQIRTGCLFPRINSYRAMTLLRGAVSHSFGDLSSPTTA